MRFNGLLIDCSRLIEPHNYYFKLIDFMAEWKMNVLLLHFSDDHGFSIRMPGFEKMAAPNAFSLQEIERLISHAGQKGIDIIPEIETFGHTRFLTDTPEYSHLYAGKRPDLLAFNALDPLNPETHSVVKKLVTATAKLFPSEYIHLGCDEVDIRDYCSQKNLAPDTVWAEYVNSIAGYAIECGKIPMIWGDHATKSPNVAQNLRKDLILFDWRYHAGCDDAPIVSLKNHGFNRIVVAPSIACWYYRCHLTETAIDNVSKMASFASQHELEGMITTVWWPHRYFQDAIWYGIAFSAEAFRQGGMPDMRKFMTEFAMKVFGTELDKELEILLELHPRVELDRKCSQAILGKDELSREDIARIEQRSAMALRIMNSIKNYNPAKNAEILNAMLLSIKAAWCCLEYLLLREKDSLPTRKNQFNRTLEAVKKEASDEWNRTRCEDDPCKYKAQFPGFESCQIMILLENLEFMPETRG